MSDACAAEPETLLYAARRKGATAAGAIDRPTLLALSKLISASARHASARADEHFASVRRMLCNCVCRAFAIPFRKYNPNSEKRSASGAHHGTVIERAAFTSGRAVGVLDGGGESDGVEVSDDDSDTALADALALDDAVADGDRDEFCDVDHRLADDDAVKRIVFDTAAVVVGLASTLADADALAVEDSENLVDVPTVDVAVAVSEDVIVAVTVLVLDGLPFDVDDTSAETETVGDAAADRDAETEEVTLRDTSVVRDGRSETDADCDGRLFERVAAKTEGVVYNDLMRVTVAVRLNVSVCRNDREISGLAETQADGDAVPILK